MANLNKSTTGRHEPVSRELESRIRSGHIRTGDRLPSEARLGREFGASRTVIREALQAMKARGLLESRRGSGTYVAEPGKTPIHDSLSWFAELQQDEGNFIELMDLRLLTETHCARQLASGKNSLKTIRHHLKEMEKSGTRLGHFAEADIAFHLAIAQASGHSLFTEVLRAVLPALGRPFALQTHTDPALAEKSIREHREIFLALEAREPARAEAAMRRHLLRSRRTLLKRIEANHPNPLSKSHE